MVYRGINGLLESLPETGGEFRVLPMIHMIGIAGIR